MKRFYKTAEAAPAATEGFRVLLDGREIKTPGRVALCLPTLPLAQAVAAEWAAQGEQVRPRDMPLMSLACSAIDLVMPRRAEVIGEIAGYAEAELLCHRAETPADLVARQHAAWQPLLDWTALTFDAPLRVTKGVRPTAQPEAALGALALAVAAHEDMALGGLAAAVKASASLVIGLALSHGQVTAAQAFEAAELDETYQIESWGEDPEAMRRRDALKAELAAAERFLALLRG